jgi:thymidine phosphorylase
MREETSDAQMAAFLMAVNCRGLGMPATHELTRAMTASGRRLSYPAGGPLVDKHSTGGVGDKTSLLLAPMLAAIGARVPMLSGRGLGHTGGTLDKLEAIRGFNVDLDDEELQRALATVGAAIAAAGSALAPADRRMYALRDTTATVPSTALIAASIMSKKIAEGTDALVLDVKHGSGAFLPEPDDARNLARLMVEIGENAGVRTSALLTSMHAPLGHAVGNALEIQEINNALEGGGPADLRELTAALAREMAELAGIDEDPVATLDDGRAKDVWRRMVKNQGGDPDAALPAAPVKAILLGTEEGYVESVDALRIGICAWKLGAGRAQPGERIDHGVGIEVRAKPGDRTNRTRVLAVVHARDEHEAALAEEAVRQAYRISPEPPARIDLITERIDAA